LHGPRIGLAGDAEPPNPVRFVLPAGSLS